MDRIAVITGFILFFISAEGQVPVGSWTDHLSYNSVKSVATGSGNIYASTGSSIIVYNKEFAELKKLSKVNGLSETGISSIAWSEENSMLIIAYNNTNIDVLHNGSVYNIPDVMNKPILENKRINRIRTNGRYAYLAAGFGIVVADPLKKEIRDTWRPGPGSEPCEVFDVAFGNGKIFAATAKGVWYADMTNPGLAYFGNWSRMNELPAPENSFTHIIYAGETLYLNESNPDPVSDIIYAAGNTIEVFENNPENVTRSFDTAPNGFTISSSGSVRYFDNSGTQLKKISSYGWGIPDIFQGVVDEDDIWLADVGYGLVRGENMTSFTSYVLPGPGNNNVAAIVSDEGTTVITGGGTDKSWNPLGRSFHISLYEEYSFTNISSATIRDPMRAAVVNGSSERIFVSTWGSGLLEYENGILKNQYTSANSPLQSFTPATDDVRICGIAADPSRNVWIAQTGSTANIKVLKPDGSWIVNPVTINAPLVGDMIITSGGYKWIILPGGYGLFVLDDNGTPGNSGDDRYKRVTVKDSENRIFPYLYSIAEDLDGTVWLGTDQGPVIYYDPENIFDEDARAFRIKIPRNDGTGLADYLLGSETITSIAVDGGNRKWLATSASGAYLLSQDGSKLLEHYSKSNSPILSDSLVAVAVDQESGEVWFGTSEGVVSMRGEATSGASDYGDVYAFPNPVREDFYGNLTITGLLRDTRIKITDISGNLVGEAVSEGGQASWDLTTYNGQRVSTGVYLIFGASPDGSMSFVTKVLVIR